MCRDLGRGKRLGGLKGRTILKRQWKMKILVFETGGQRYAVPIENVVETARAATVTPVQRVSPAVEGMINCRGRLTPVVDLGLHLGHARAEMVPEHDFVVAACDQRNLILHVERADCVIDVADSSLEMNASALPNDCFLAIAKLPEGMVFVLDLSKILTQLDEGGLEEVASEQFDQQLLPAGI